MSGGDPRPPAEEPKVSLLRRFLTFRRGPWENLAVALITLGVIMMTQSFYLALFSWSFTFVLTGTILFVIVSHFPD